MIQLNPTIPVITPKGKAIAHFLIDNGIESDLQWVCFQDSNGECWTWKNPDVRAQKNITHGRDYISPFYNPEDVALKKPTPDYLFDVGEDFELYQQDGFLYVRRKQGSVASGVYFVEAEPPHDGKPCGCQDSEPVSQQDGKTTQLSGTKNPITPSDMPGLEDFPGYIQHLWGQSWPEEGKFRFSTQSGESFFAELQINPLTNCSVVILPSDYDPKNHGSIKTWRQADKWKKSNQLKSKN